MNIEITAPVVPRNILRVDSDIVPSLNVVSIVVSRVSIDTQAAARLIAFEAIDTGLLYLRYLIRFMIARVNAVNVYAAIIIAVISW